MQHKYSFEDYTAKQKYPHIKHVFCLCRMVPVQERKLWFITIISLESIDLIFIISCTYTKQLHLVMNQDT